jgi:hypothetical protein
MRIIFRCDPALADHLPQPIAARDTLPAWLKEMPAHRYSEIHGRTSARLSNARPSSTPWRWDS